MNATTTSPQPKSLQPNSQLNSLANQKAENAGNWVQRHKIASLITAVVVLLACGAGYYMMTGVTGIEMQASSWKVRRFSFRRDPFTNYQFTAVQHQGIAFAPLWSNTSDAPYSTVDPTILTHLGGSSIGLDRWDLVQIDDSVASDGPAKPLYRLLNSDRGFSKEHSAVWSSESPKLAAILWPAARELTELGLYHFTPDLLAITFEDLDEAAFKRRVGNYIQESMIKHCQRHDISKDDKTAAAQLGLRYGDNSTLQEHL
ncbi:MAG: hypothetical protein Aurels2KO_13900 [Aureliella sp.]